MTKSTLNPPPKMPGNALQSPPSRAAIHPAVSALAAPRLLASAPLSLSLLRYFPPARPAQRDIRPNHQAPNRIADNPRHTRQVPCLLPALDGYADAIQFRDS